MPNPTEEMRRQHSARVRSHPFQVPIVDESAPKLPGLGKPNHCSCPGFCQGRDSADWATCSAECGHCNPGARRRRRGGPIIQNDPSSDHAEQPD
jgi:hypothetical protein